MPAYVRSAGAWIESTPRARNADAWSGDNDALYVRDGGAWVLIHPDPADAGDLLPVENLAVTAGPTNNSATIGWTNPTQPTITPTEVHVRLANITAVWTVYDYPITSVAWSALDSDFEYFAQVRLVRRVDGEITDTSPIESIAFTTDPAPIGEPAPDPGGSGGDTIFPWTPVGGTPAPGGSPTGCYWEWKIQILNQTTLAWTDTGLTGTADGASAAFSYDLATLDPTRVYRIARREVCNTVPGAWEYGEPFVGLGDWGAACGGITGNTTAGFAPMADAIWGFPEMCTLDGGERQGIVDSVTGVEIEPGSGFGLVYHDLDGEWVVLADSTGGPVLLVPNAAVDETFVAGADHSIALSVRADGAWSPTNGTVRALLSIGFNHKIQMVETATGWKVRINYLTDSGSFTLDSTEIPTDTEWHAITIVWDDSGLKKIYVDGNEVASGGNGVQLGPEAVTPSIVASVPANWTTRSHYGWGRALTPTEVGEIANLPVQLVGIGAMWNDYPTVTAHGPIPYPAGVQTGDLLVFLRAYSGGDRPDSSRDPAGWTLQTGLTAGIRVCTRIADGTEGASLSFTTGPGADNGVTACIMAFRYQHPTTPFDSLDSDLLTPFDINLTINTDGAIGVAFAQSDLSSSHQFTTSGNWTAGEQKFTVAPDRPRWTGITILEGAAPGSYNPPDNAGSIGTSTGVCFAIKGRV